jgi:hypothetical protein
MLRTDVVVPKVNRASRCRREYGPVPRGWLWIRKRLRHGFIVSLGADDVTDCLGGRGRRCRNLLNRTSTQVLACPLVTVGYPGLLADRARNGHGKLPGCGSCVPPHLPIGLTAAALFTGGEESRADSRVR